jgi:signal transduction histidine kinase/ligand-binding sensor domain-containing protein
MYFIHKPLYFILLITLSLSVSCSRENPTPTVKSQAFKPAITVAAGSPKITVGLNEVSKPAGKPVINIAAANQRKTGAFPKAELMSAVPPAINILGTRFPLPDIRTAKTRSALPGQPEVIEANDPSSHDINPSNFSFFKVQHGISQSTVRAIYQDRAGKLWFGTYSGGVSSYDGKYFTHYKSAQGLSSDVVLSILQDRNGNYWFGTSGGGVTKYDGETFTYYTTTEGLIDNTVNSLCEGADGKIWMGTNGGLSAFDGKYFFNYSAKNGLCGDFVFKVLADHRGKIWCGTASGVSCFNGKSFTNYTEQQGLINNVVLSVFEDSDHTVWFGTLGGASHFNGASFTNITTSEGLGDNAVYGILRDREANLWFCTSNGITCLNGNTFTYHTEKQGLSNNMVFCALAGRSGSIWFGTNGGGVCRYLGNSFTNHGEWNGLPANVIFSMLESKDSVLWFGTMGGGLARYNGSLTSVWNVNSGMCGNTVYDLCEDHSGRIWIASDAAGVCRYDGRSFTSITAIPPLHKNTVYSIHEDKRKRMWFATESSGVFMISGDSCMQYTTDQGLIHNIVYTILEDSGGGLWFGTYGGLSYFNGTSFTNFTREQGLPDNLVLCAMQDRNGLIWVGTNSGACYIRDKMVRRFTKNEGFNNNAVLSLIQDADGNIWFGSRKGLLKLESAIAARPEKLADSLHGIYNFGYNEGFPGANCRRNSVLRDSKGRIWWGADYLECLNYNGLVIDTTAPDVSITGLRLSGQNIDWMSLLEKKHVSRKYPPRVTNEAQQVNNGLVLKDIDLTSLSKWNGLPEDLSLPHKLSNLRFDFNATHIQDRKFIKYQFMLKALDDDWSPATHVTQANYASVPAGNYTFMVKAVNQSGNWSRTAEFSFEIREAWWRTWWFRLLCIILIVGLTRLYIWWRERISRTMNEALEKKNKELVKINSELDRFVYSASHELRSPLTSVLGLLQITKPEVTTDSLAKKLNLMKTAIERLDSFILDIISYSKNSRLKINSERIDFRQLIGESRRQLAFMPEMEHIRFTVSIQDDTNFYSDTKRISVLLNNLISNSVKYSKPGYKDARIKITVVTNPKNMTLEIADNGVGIPAKYINRVFDMFFRASEGGTGSGLGLYISKEIVEKLDGAISVTSEQNEGTTFYVTLPNKISEASMSESELSSRQPI